ncbi:MAG: sulfotransferase [Actinobacteria bacterium]|nr:sulfotransferase [Actinomycetota bacterium]
MGSQGTAASPLHARPVIIIGAPRSGTNLLRDLLGELRGFATWDCDELNPMWRYRNSRADHDELTEEQATDDIARYVRRRFDRLGRREGAHTVVEKTCANSLRLPYVHRLLPEARFVIITRNGLDATASIIDRWQGSTPLGYLARKARHAPPSVLPMYAANFVSARFRRVTGIHEHANTWGPRYRGIDDELRHHGLDYVAARQWTACVDGAIKWWESQATPHVFSLTYEALTSSPTATFGHLCDFLDARPSQAGAWLIETVPNSRSVGKGYRSLSPSRRATILDVIESTMARRETLPAAASIS